MTIFLIILVILFVLGFTAVLLPVHCRFEARGGTDSGVNFSGNVNPWSGLAGVGVVSSKGGYRVQLLLFSRAVIDADVTRLIRRGAAKKASKSKKAKAVDAGSVTAKESQGEKLRNRIEKLKEYYGYFSEGKQIIRDIVRFDFVTADVTLGLGNPAITGMITGVLFAVNDLMPREYTIRPSFDFTREVLDGDVWAELTVFPFMVWKHLFIHASDLMRLARSRRTRDAEIITQEV